MDYDENNQTHLYACITYVVKYRYMGNKELHRSSWGVPHDQFTRTEKHNHVVLVRETDHVFTKMQDYIVCRAL